MQVKRWRNYITFKLKGSQEMLAQPSLITLPDERAQSASVLRLPNTLHMARLSNLSMHVGVHMGDGWLAQPIPYLCHVVGLQASQALHDLSIKRL